MKRRADPFLPDPFPEPWAAEWGEDRRCLWMTLSLGGVRQRFLWIAPGTFRMGSCEDEMERRNDETPHEVTITRGYWLADTTCSQALWQAVMGENPSRFKEDPRNPVEQVSWEDAQRFMARLGGKVSGLQARLPTEAEWEYACRAGTETPFSFGANIAPKQVNYDGGYPYAGGKKSVSRGTTIPAGRLPSNRWGLYQMHGNVLEWCADWYGNYDEGPQFDPTGPSQGEARVLRGGSWIHGGRHCRSANRFWAVPAKRGDNFGFRVVLGQGAFPGGEPTGG